MVLMACCLPHHINIGILHEVTSKKAMHSWRLFSMQRLNAVWQKKLPFLQVRLIEECLKTADASNACMCDFVCFVCFVNFLETAPHAWSPVAS